jgi:predicted nucleotidyltransferase
MRITAALDDLLATRGHVRILRALDGLPDGFAVSARDMARRAEVAHNRTSEVLSALTEIGFAQVQRAGRADLYQLNRDHVMYPAVHELFQQEAAVESGLQKLLRRRLAKMRRVREAYIFGSVARGESRTGSDIDLALVIPPAGPTVAEQAEIDEIAAEVRRRFGSELGVHVSPQPVAYRVKGRAGRDLWRRIETEGIRLLPTESRSG